MIGEQLLEKVKQAGKTPNYYGLVEDMSVYELNKQTIPPPIIHFYERTMDYQLSATIKWASWFKPCAALYRIGSQLMQQINLPLHQQEVNMTGGIWGIQQELDGRTAPRAWVRKIEDNIVFVALYSEHRTNEKNYKLYEYCASLAVVYYDRNIRCKATRDKTTINKQKSAKPV